MNPIQQAEQALEAFLTGDLTPYAAAQAIDNLRSLQKEVEGVELPVVTLDDRDFLTDNPNTDAVIEWMQAYARTAVAAALGRGAVRQGWKLVPVEPTPEMRKAAADAWLDCDSKLFLNKAGAAVRAAIAISKESA